MDHNRGVDLGPGGPGIQRVERRMLKEKQKQKKKKKKISKSQGYQLPGPVNAALGALEGLRVRGCGFATRAPSHSGIPSFHRCWLNASPALGSEDGETEARRVLLFFFKAVFTKFTAWISQGSPEKQNQLEVCIHTNSPKRMRVKYFDGAKAKCIQ